MATVKVNLNGIGELDFPTGVTSATAANGVATVNLSASGGGGGGGTTGPVAFGAGPLATDPADDFYASMDVNGTDSKTSTAPTNTAVTFVSGKFSNAASFNGTTSFLNYGNIINEASDHSISCWVNFSALPASTVEWTLVIKGKEAANSTNYRLSIVNTSGTYYVKYREVAALGRAHKVVFTPSTGVWYHLCVTIVNGATIPSIYVNGIQGKLVLDDGAAGTYTCPTNTLGLYFGSAQLEASPTFFNGLIDDVTIFSRALNSADVEILADGLGGGLNVSGMYVTNGTNYFVGPTFFPCTLPVAGNYSWVNQGTASEVAAGNALFLSDNTTGTTGNLRIRTKAIPGGTTTLLAALICFIPNDNVANHNALAGVGFRESATGKLLTLNLGNLITAAAAMRPEIEVFSYTNPTTFNASRATWSGAPLGVTGLAFFKLVYNGTNVTLSVSPDGVNFMQVYTAAKTADFTTAPDQWFYFVNPQGNTPACSATLLSWTES